MKNIPTAPIIKTFELIAGYSGKKKSGFYTSSFNLALNRGEMSCLLGKNGIGKSTLIRTLCKMQHPVSGKVLIDGIDLIDLNGPELAQKISVVLTERIPASNLTVFELIALGRQPYTNWMGSLSKSDHYFIEQAIEMTDLKDLVNRRLDELSDGQLQRSMICRALAQNTDIIILDEPTAHLDIQHKIETFKLLKRIVTEQQKSILISTHEVQLATQMADVLWLMLENRMIVGKPETLINSDQINLLFDNDSIQFDKESKQFVTN